MSGAPELLGVGEAAVVAVGDGDEFDAGNLDRGAGVALALDAGADEGELDGVIRRTCDEIAQGEVSDVWYGGSGGGLCSGLKECSAIQHR